MLYVPIFIFKRNKCFNKMFYIFFFLYLGEYRYDTLWKFFFTNHVTLSYLFPSRKWTI